MINSLSANSKERKDALPEKGCEKVSLGRENNIGAQLYFDGNEHCGRVYSTPMGIWKRDGKTVVGRGGHS